MDFSKFADGSVLWCTIYGGDDAMVIIGSWKYEPYRHCVVRLDGCSWSCDKDGDTEFGDPRVLTVDSVLRHGPAQHANHEPTFTDRLTTIEQQLADIKAAQKSSAELLMLASRLIDAIDGKPPQQANPSLCSDAGVVSFSVNPSVRTLDLIKALGNAVATFGLRLECSYNSKLVVYEIKIEMPQ